MISNDYIEQVLSRTSSTFRGCYASDFLPRHNYRDLPASLVINTSRHSIPLGHFVSIYETDHCLYFMDSLGLEPWVETVTHFIERSGKPVVYNTTPIQSPQSPYCAFFSIAFVLWCEKVSVNIPDFISVFDGNNDDIVIKLINILIKIYCHERYFSRIFF